MLRPQEELVVTIPFEKTMKSFEEYPHDMFRGEDMIGLPVTCMAMEVGVVEEIKRQVVNSNSVVTNPFIPDTSMPFHIITFTFGAYTMMYLAIMRMTGGYNAFNHWMYQ